MTDLSVDTLRVGSAATVAPIITLVDVVAALLVAVSFLNACALNTW